MTSRERVFACLAGQPTDRTPFFVQSSLYGARLTRCELGTYYRDARAYADGQAACVDLLGADIVLAPFAVTKEGEAFGSRLRYTEKGPPNLLEPALPAASEVRRCRPPDVDREPALLYFRDAVRLLAERHKSDTVIGAAVLGPADLPAMVLGIEAWLEVLLFQRADAEWLIGLCAEHFARFANALLADGADLLVVSTSFVGPTVMPPGLARDVALPGLAAGLAELKGPVMLHHSGGPVGEMPAMTLGLPSVIGYVVDSRDDLGAVRATVGPGYLLSSGPEGPGLHGRTADAVRDECLAMLADRAADPRFILGTTAADVERETPSDVLLTLREAVMSAKGAP